MRDLNQLIETIKSHELSGQHEVKLGKSATDEEISAFEAEAGFSLTKNLKALYRFVNGLVFVIKGAEYSILSLKEAGSFLHFLNQYQLPQLKQAFPLFDNNDSNLWLVSCAEPLEDYIIYLPHDGEMAVKYRSMESLFAIMNWYILPYFSETTYQYFSMPDMPSDMSQSLHLREDDIRARKLLEIAEPLPQWDRVYGINLALNLISENALDAIEDYLYDTDVSVSGDVYYRIKEMGATDFKARHLIENFEQEIEDFTQTCAAALRQAGVEVLNVKYGFRATISVASNPSPTHLNATYLFLKQYHGEDAISEIVEKMKKSQTRKQ